MPSSEEPKGPNPPESGATPEQTPKPEEPHGEHSPSASDQVTGETHTSYSQTVDDPYNYYDDPYHSDVHQTEATTTAVTPAPVAAMPPAAPPPKPPKEAPKDEEDEDDDGMLRMSFLEHLEELRLRLIRMLMGMGVAFFACLLFSDKLWMIVSEPAITALKRIYPNNPQAWDLVMLAPIDGFSIIWVKVPLLTAVFIAAPWILYQVWAFIAPGLYQKEKKWAAPFVICTAGLFILGGCFAYFVAFRYGLEFLLGIGNGMGVRSTISIVEYVDLFINVMLGVGLVFEMPILIFFLTLLRVTTPKFLLEHSRYAILIITIIAAIVTPTPDVFNLMLFAVPMVLLYFVGVFASYILWLRRENEKFPWKAFFIWLASAILIIFTAVYLLVTQYHYKLVPYWPFLSK